ncbi:hypothetical protein Slala02_64560 [Streptomyces lavendulae subsp. lavendulae]|nr:hypothetical protein Slala01_68180 [Streptomyces lavendulae subsp. lavendulae]GLX30636.1 hypothetical protein Slala02_64560 [Streptomyces lavendulae subsp. lavendulae]
MDIRELIRGLRGARGWSQARLADEIDAMHGTKLTIQRQGGQGVGVIGPVGPGHHKRSGCRRRGYADPVVEPANLGAHCVSPACLCCTGRFHWQDSVPPPA